MDKELQNKAWAALPNEFKEEVKETYLEYSKLIAISDKNTDRYKGYLGAQTELELLFGESNLTDENHSKVEKIGKDWKDSEGEQTRNFSKNAENENYSSDTSQKTPNLRSNLRLQVAMAAMQGILCNPNVMMSCGCFEDNQEYITKHAVMYANALLNELGIKGKGGSENG